MAVMVEKDGVGIKSTLEVSETNGSLVLPTDVMVIDSTKQHRQTCPIGWALPTTRPTRMLYVSRSMVEMRYMEPNRVNARVVVKPPIEVAQEGAKWDASVVGYLIGT
ncbi:unnamed protein product [Ilex paraguariensis]|uniref:Uncharacterized protein n=1 Tax=Ilex paraguariensis TaxID=185542 RepID=A0ABC8RNK0_9AQUA